MELGNKKSSRLLTYFKVSFYLGLVGNLVFFILVSLSHYYAIINGYNWKIWELSELVLYGLEGKIYFMLATIIDGIFLLFPLIALRCYFLNKTQKTIYLVIASITIFTLIGLGAISEDMTYWGHYIISVIFFVFVAILILYTAFYFIKNYKEKLVFYSMMGFIIFIFYVFYVITREFFGKSYTQRIAVLLSIIYFMSISGRLLLKDDLIHHENMILK